MKDRLTTLYGENKNLISFCQIQSQIEVLTQIALDPICRLKIKRRRGAYNKYWFYIYIKKGLLHLNKIKIKNLQF